MSLSDPDDYSEDVIPAELLDDAPSLSVFSDQERPWRIEDDGGAEWAMRVYARAANNAARYRGLAAAWKAKIDAWLEHQLGDPSATMARMEALLKDYALRRRLADPKAKATLTLPSGAVTSSHHQPTVTVADPAAFVAWAQRSGHADLIRQPDPPAPQPAVAAIKKAATIRWLSGLRCCLCGLEAVDPGENVLVDLPAPTVNACDHDWEKTSRPVIAIGDELPDGLDVKPEDYTFDVKPS